MQVPDSLAYRIELFRERGLVPPYREGMFLDASWLAVYLGQRVIPRHYDPASDRVPERELAGNLAGIRETCRRAAESLPPHDEFLRRIGATQPGQSLQ